MRESCVWPLQGVNIDNAKHRPRNLHEHTIASTSDVSDTSFRLATACLRLKYVEMKDDPTDWRLNGRGGPANHQRHVYAAHVLRMSCSKM